MYVGNEILSRGSLQERTWKDSQSKGELRYPQKALPSPPEKWSLEEYLYSVVCVCVCVSVR